MILENLHDVLRRMDAAACRAGRDPSQLRLVAVTKTAPPEAVRELAQSGEVRDIGESRVQDAARKKGALQGLQVRWRLIGHLQTNKVKQALETFDAVDSLDSLHLAERLEERLSETGRELPVLVQVKLTERETQYGIAPEEAEGFLAAVRKFGRLKVQGLMGIAPMADPAEAVRPSFKRLKELFDRSFPEGGILSMGMSGDFEIAIEEGANMVRVGSALFEQATV